MALPRTAPMPHAAPAHLPSFRPRPLLQRIGRFALTCAAPLVFATGCDFLAGKKQESRNSKPAAVDARVRRTVPDKAFAIGKSRLTPTPQNGRFAPQAEHTLKRQARESAYAKLRSAFKQKHPAIRCISPMRTGGRPIRIIEDTGCSHYELKLIRRKGRAYNYYLYKAAWERIQCNARARLAGRAVIHLFMLENPHRALFHN